MHFLPKIFCQFENNVYLCTRKVREQAAPQQSEQVLLRSACAVLVTRKQYIVEYGQRKVFL